MSLGTPRKNLSIGGPLQTQEPGKFKSLYCRAANLEYPSFCRIFTRSEDGRSPRRPHVPPHFCSLRNPPISIQILRASATCHLSNKAIPRANIFVGGHARKFNGYYKLSNFRSFSVRI